MRRILVSVMLLAVAVGTSAGADNAPAPSKAKRIQVVVKPPSDCRSLGQVLGVYSKAYSDSEVWSETDSQVATTAAQQDLLGNAETRGATHVVMEAVNSARNTYTNTGFATGAAYQCSPVETK